MNAINRADIKIGTRVQVVQKQDQRSGRLTEGIVKDILTKSSTHPHGMAPDIKRNAFVHLQGIQRHSCTFPVPQASDNAANGLMRFVRRVKIFERFCIV